MIVRRITAGAAGLALVGTAFAAAPAMAKTNTTTVKLDSNTLGVITAVGINAKALPKAKLKGTTVTIPAKLAGKFVTHDGGIQLENKDGKFLGFDNIKINVKTGKASADVPNSTLGTVPVKNALLFKGGKNTIKKNGMWKNANVTLAEKVKVPVGDTPTEFTAQAVIALIFGIDEATVNQALPGAIPLGKATIKVKK